MPKHHIKLYPWWEKTSYQSQFKTYERHSANKFVNIIWSSFCHQNKTLRHWDAVRWTEFGWLSFGVLDQKQRVWFRSKAATKFEIKNGLRLEINECQKRVGDASDMVGIIILSGWTSLPKSSAIRNGIDLIAYYRFSAIQSDEDNYFIILFFAWAATGFWLRFLFGKI